MYGTFNGWKQQGRVVEYGQRAVFRNEYGDKMFHITQTVPRGYPMQVIRPVRRIVSYY